MAERDPEGQTSVEQRGKILLMGIDRPEKRNGLVQEIVPAGQELERALELAGNFARPTPRPR